MGNQDRAPSSHVHQETEEATIDLYTFKDKAEETSGAHDTDSCWLMLHTFFCPWQSPV